VIIREFEILPAIDVLEGRVVRLRHGQREAVTLEGGDPVELARRYAAEGASWLHLVDLDGAFSGTPSLDLLARVAEAGGLPLQVGGGYRSLDAVAAALEVGAARVMVGTAALSPGFLEEAVPRFGEGLVVAVDGWVRGSDVTPRALAARCAGLGVARLLVTATSRDGSLAGPDLELLGTVIPAGVPVLAAGGIAALADLAALHDAGCEGAIVGSALLAGRFTLPEALALAGR